MSIFPKLVGQIYKSRCCGMKLFFSGEVRAKFTVDQAPR